MEPCLCPIGSEHQSRSAADSASASSSSTCARHWTAPCPDGQVACVLLAACSIWRAKAGLIILKVAFVGHPSWEVRCVCVFRCVPDDIRIGLCSTLGDRLSVAEKQQASITCAAPWPCRGVVAMSPLERVFILDFLDQMHVQLERITQRRAQMVALCRWHLRPSPAPSMRLGYCISWVLQSTRLFEIKVWLCRAAFLQVTDVFEELPLSYEVRLSKHR